MNYLRFRGISFLKHCREENSLLSLSKNHFSHHFPTRNFPSYLAKNYFILFYCSVHTGEFSHKFMVFTCSLATNLPKKKTAQIYVVTTQRKTYSLIYSVHTNRVTKLCFGGSCVGNQTDPFLCLKISLLNFNLHFLSHAKKINYYNCHV